MTRNKRHILHIVRTLLAVVFLSAFLTRCAHMLSPTGGPIDTLPPVIVAMTPDNFTKNRPLTKHEKIYIEFNEFVQLKDQQKEFYTSPAMKKKPLLTLRGRGIVVQLRDTLEPNTTYALNFGGSVRDNNEGNPLFSMRYVFSTGNEIDSMYMSGYTADSYKADSVPKSFIWFFPADSVEDKPEYDSTIFKYKPAVIARAETNGIFIAQNLKPIDYRVYAVQDKNDNQLYEPGTDQVGFIEGRYNPAKLPDFSIWYDSLRRYVSAEPQLYIRMFTDKAFRRQMLSEQQRPMQHKALLYFSSAHPRIESIHFDSIPDDHVIIDPQTEGRDTIALWFNHPSKLLPDTIRGKITYMKHDTLNVLQKVTENLKLPWKLVESKQEEKERKRIEEEKKKAEAEGREYKNPLEKNPFEIKFPTSGEINPEKYLEAEFDHPLVKIDSAAISLVEVDGKSGAEQPLAVHFVRDTAKMLRWEVRAAWKPKAKYKLTIPAGALTNAAGFRNDSISGEYTAYDPEKFAIVKLHVKGRADATKYIIQLTDASNRVQQERRDVSSGDVQFNYVSPGEIKFRIIEDKNANGKWDTGNVVERRMPERAEFYINENAEEVFSTKANWEVEVTMDLEKLFAPVTMQSLQRMLDEREVQRLKKEAERLAKEGPKKNRERERMERQQRDRNFGSAGNMFDRR